MAGNKNHITSPEQFQRYLDNTMSPKERHDFEARMLDDDFESEAFEGLESLDKESFSEDLQILQSRLKAKTQKTSTPIYWRIAATLLLLAVFSFSVFYLIDSNSPSEISQNKAIPVPEKIQEDRRDTLGQNEITDQETEENLAYQQKSKVADEAQATNQNRKLAEEKAEITQGPALAETSQTEPDLAYDAPEEIADEDILVLEKEELPAAAPQSLTKSAPAVLSESVSSRQKKESSNAKSIQAARASTTKTISGKVMSQTDDEVIPGVNVVIKGTANGTVTDIEGNYTIEVPATDDAVLVYSSVGYVSEEVAVGDSDKLDVNIEPDVTALSEIVVTGYATQRRSEVTGAVSEVNAEDLYNYTPPQPAGGQEKFKNYIKENLRYPISGVEEKIKGTVKLKFTVTETGSIEYIQIVKSLGAAFDNEAMRILQEGPKWEPALEKDKKIPKTVTLKIRFRPPEQ